jgi:hypothetical protein
VACGRGLTAIFGCPPHSSFLSPTLNKQCGRLSAATALAHSNTPILYCVMVRLWVALAHFQYTHLCHYIRSRLGPKNRTQHMRLPPSICLAQHHARLFRPLALACGDRMAIDLECGCVYPMGPQSWHAVTLPPRAVLVCDGGHCSTRPHVAAQQGYYVSRVRVLPHLPCTFLQHAIAHPFCVQCGILFLLS